ncbi:hypothetical protein ASE01_13280 [Nocardioides sp. Root190]|uniref:Flp family type IVb pilin n=1 Tax=Nocardioides sp. Root190 TaxID=1736488 RepID=UPI0006F7A198|nr:Flp family type IVb pilin [Nocardioides sp. Root190]KRB76009.1 hypothetical protein ASE01_13280 [Nocardioides sp. Root190]
MAIATICACWLGPTAFDRQRGASSVEYALLISLIAAAIVLAVGVFGLSVADLFDVDFTP